MNWNCEMISGPSKTIQTVWLAWIVHKVKFELIESWAARYFLHLILNIWILTHCTAKNSAWQFISDMLKVMIRLKVTGASKRKATWDVGGGNERIIVMLLCFEMKWMDFDVDHYEQWLILFGTAQHSNSVQQFSQNLRLNYSVENSKSFAVDKTSKCWNLIEFKCLLLFRICFSDTLKTRNKSPEK